MKIKFEQRGGGGQGGSHAGVWGTTDQAGQCAKVLR